MLKSVPKKYLEHPHKKKNKLPGQKETPIYQYKNIFPE